MPKAKQDAVTQGRLREYATPQPGPVTVEAGVLKDVLLLGTTSRNRADYSHEVMQKAVAKYEGAACYVGHARDGGNPEYDRKLGVHRNVHVAADGLRGDFHFNPKHQLAEQLVWDAQNDPRGVGFSHDADCTYQLRNGRKQVTCIDRVFSVDLVTRPGTTRGLFEDEEQQVASVPGLAELAESSLAAMDHIRSILFTQDADMTQKRSRLAEAVAEWHTELIGTPEPAAADANLREEQGMDLKELTLEELTKERPDLVAKLQGTDETSRLTEEVTSLKTAAAAKDQEIVTLKAVETKRLTEETIAAELKAAEFPTGDQAAFSASFQEQLRAAPDKAARETLIKDRLALVKGRVREEAGLPSPMADLKPGAGDAAPNRHFDGVFGAAK